MNQIFPRPSFGETVSILVPKLEAMDKWQQHIKAGSAIVGFMADDRHYSLYYEGNLYDFANIKTFKDRAVVAYGRLTTKAPTIARTGADEDEFEIVGKMDRNHFETYSTPAFLEWTSRDLTLVAA